MHQENLNYERYRKYQIREYVQARNETQHKNTNEPWSLDFVYLCPLKYSQEGHNLLHL